MASSKKSGSSAQGYYTKVVQGLNQNVPARGLAHRKFTPAPASGRYTSGLQNKK